MITKEDISVFCFSRDNNTSKRIVLYVNYFS